MLRDYSWQTKGTVWGSRDWAWVSDVYSKFLTNYTICQTPGNLSSVYSVEIREHVRTAIAVAPMLMHWVCRSLWFLWMEYSTVRIFQKLLSPIFEEQIPSDLRIIFQWDMMVETAQVHVEGWGPCPPQLEGSWDIQVNISCDMRSQRYETWSHI